MCQGTPLTIKRKDVYHSVYCVENTGNGPKEQKYICLSEQLYSEDHSMHTKRPINHKIVGLAALFAFLGHILGVGLLRENPRSLLTFVNIPGKDMDI